jgi:FG-GAP-like repeat
MRWACLFGLMIACSSSSPSSDAGTCQSADCAALTAPTGLTVSAGNQFALVRWNAGSGTGYLVTATTSGTVLAQKTTQTGLLFGGLTSGSNYQFTVASTVADGTGPASAAVAVTLPAVCDRTFALYLTFPAGTGPTTVVAADIDNDGFIDLAVTQANGVSVLINDQQGNFTNKTDYPLATSPGFLVAADFDSSGLPGLAVSGTSTTLFLNDGSGKFDGGVDLGFASSFLVTGDFDNSGLPGLVAASSGSATARVFTNSGLAAVDGGTALNDAGTVNLGLVPGFLVAGDFNADTIVDLAAVNGSQANVEVVSANADGGGGFLPPVAWDGGSNALSVAAADFNSDGLTDLATAGADGQLHVQISDAGTFAAQQAFDAGALADFLVAADLDLDTFSDLIYTASTQNRLGVMFNAQDGGFAPAQIFSTGVHPSSVAVADFNDDGFPDLAVANTADGTIGIYINVCKP